MNKGQQSKQKKAASLSLSIDKMLLKTILPLFLTVPLIAASNSLTRVERRQYVAANDLNTGNCKDTMFIFARGSTEVGNEVSISFT